MYRDRGVRRGRRRGGGEGGTREEGMGQGKGSGEGRGGKASVDRRETCAEGKLQGKGKR